MVRSIIALLSGLGLVLAAPQFGFGGTTQQTTYSCSNSLDTLECCTAGSLSVAGINLVSSGCSAGTEVQGLFSTGYTCPADTTAYCCLVSAGSTDVACSAATSSSSGLGGIGGIA